MTIRLADWEFAVDYDATWDYTHKCSLDHCTCPYCLNFYENLDLAPSLRPVLQRFGVYADGPSEVMPFEPTLVAACYRVTGQIVKRGEAYLNIDHTLGSLDAIGVSGNGATRETLIEAGVSESGLVIALTGSDELNLLCCLIAKRLGAKATIARVRNPDYHRDLDIIKRPSPLIGFS